MRALVELGHRSRDRIALHCQLTKHVPGAISGCLSLLFSVVTIEMHNSDVLVFAKGQQFIDYQGSEGRLACFLVDGLCFIYLFGKILLGPR